MRQFIIPENILQSMLNYIAQSSSHTIKVGEILQLIDSLRNLKELQGEKNEERSTESTQAN
jgi:hypothetical protein